MEGKATDNKQREALETVSKLLFSASERIAEALETYDLEMDGETLKTSEVANLGIWKMQLEQLAQIIQKRARR